MALVLSQKLIEYRKKSGLSQSELGTLIGKSQQAIGHYEKGIREPSFRDVQLLSEALGCTPADLMGLETRLRIASEPVSPAADVSATLRRIELPLVTVPNRPRFVELNLAEKNYGLTDTIPILSTDPTRQYEGQVVVEINGDNMEPRLCMGDRVRCLYVSPDNWAFLPAGVYGVAFSHYFVVKRVKNNELQARQFLTLHSDNLQTGGSLDVPREQIRHVWQVVEIVNGWIR
jgi:transcriptional regulator with XRE-family HTH domain